MQISSKYTNFFRFETASFCWFKTAVLYIFPYCFSIAAFSQIIMNNNPPMNSPQNLVNTVLMGVGVTATNITFKGTSDQIGFFDAKNSNLGLKSGVVLSTGDINDIDPSNGSIFSSGTGFSNPGDPDLHSVANAVPPLIGQTFTIDTTYDAAILEFDFIPSSDTVNFRYIFGSNEYLTFVNKKFNDVFGFFISGPGITGPYAGNSQNIAFVPQSNPLLPITVSSVNDRLNTQYYIDNPSKTSVGFKGFTTVFTAISPVVCGQTYHIRLAVADGQDSRYDSGVFLEAYSFSSGNFLTTGEPSNPSIYGDSVLFENCGDATIRFGRSGGVFKKDTLFLSMTGSAKNGVDYTKISNQVIFDIGAVSAELNFSVIEDNISEGLENLIINLTGSTSSCLQATGSYTFLLYDRAYPRLSSVESKTDTLFCINDSIAITHRVTDGVEGYTYLWSSGDTVSDIWVKPQVDTKYFISVTDVCSSVVVDTITVIVPSKTVSVMPIISGAKCEGDAGLVSVSLSGGYKPSYNTWWSNGIKNATSQIVSPNITTSYDFFVTDACGTDTSTASVEFSVPIYSPIIIDPLLPDTQDCAGHPFTIKPSVSGGSGEYFYSWNEWASLDTAVIISPDVDTTYVLEVTDFCRTDTVTANASIIVRTYNPLFVDVFPDSLLVCPDSLAEFRALPTGGSGFYEYEWSDFGGSDSIATYRTDKTKNYWLQVKDYCGNLAQKTPLKVIVSTPKSNFSYFYDASFAANFTNLSTGDSLYYSWDFGDGYTSADTNATHEYTVPDIYNVTLTTYSQFGCYDTTTHRVVPPIVIWIPNSFSPNNDGINDELIIKSLGLETFEISIFDKWGTRVYFSENPTHTWDGTPKKGKKEHSATYSYILKYKGIHKQEEQRTGKITTVK